MRKLSGNKRMTKFFPLFSACPCNLHCCLITRFFIGADFWGYISKCSFLNNQAHLCWAVLYAGYLKVTEIKDTSHLSSHPQFLPHCLFQCEFTQHRNSGVTEVGCDPHWRSKKGTCMCDLNRERVLPTQGAAATAVAHGRRFSDCSKGDCHTQKLPVLSMELGAMTIKDSIPGARDVICFSRNI